MLFLLLPVVDGFWSLRRRLVIDMHSLLMVVRVDHLSFGPIHRVFVLRFRVDFQSDLNVLQSDSKAQGSWERHWGLLNSANAASVPESTCKILSALKRYLLHFWSTTSDKAYVFYVVATPLSTTTPTLRMSSSSAWWEKATCAWQTVEGVTIVGDSDGNVSDYRSDVWDYTHHTLPSLSEATAATACVHQSWPARMKAEGTD